MSYIAVDVEADGPCPGLHSMVSFGAVIVRPGLNDTFYGEVKPVTSIWIVDALAVSGVTRAQHEKFPEPMETMVAFKDWIIKNSVGRPRFITDNLAFDWQWINWYFHKYCGVNPFGFSGSRIGDLYAGLKKIVFSNWRELRTVKHTHNPVQDAMGVAEVLLKMKDRGLGIRFD
jgi:hypothetical protein